MERASAAPDSFSSSSVLLRLLTMSCLSCPLIVCTFVSLLVVEMDDGIDLCPRLSLRQSSHF